MKKKWSLTFKAVIDTNGPGLAAVPPSGIIKIPYGAQQTKLLPITGSRALCPRIEVWDVPMSYRAGMAARTC